MMMMRNQLLGRSCVLFLSGAKICLSCFSRNEFKHVNNNE